MRAERLIAIEELNKQRQKLVDLQLQIGNSEIENKSIKEQREKMYAVTA